MADRRFLGDDWETPDPEPGPGGAMYYVRAEAHTLPDLENAFVQMGDKGGNVIRFLPGRHTVEARARGLMLPGLANAKPGLPGAPNLFAGDPGHELLGVRTGAVAFPVVDLAAVLHWGAVGLNIIGSDFAGIRLSASGGSPDHPVPVWGNTITDCHHAGIQVQGWWRDPWTSMGYVDIAGNRVSAGTIERRNPEYAELVYIGAGLDLPARPEWVDTTHHVTVRRNKLEGATAESVEVKVGATDFVIEDNEIWGARLSPGTDDTSIPVGHIAVCYANTPQPGGDTPVRGVVRRNRLYDLHQDGGVIRAPIIIGRGGVQCYANIISGCDAPTAILVAGGHGGMGAGEILVAHNTSDKNVVDNPGEYVEFVDRWNLSNAKGSVVGPTTGAADAGWGHLSGYAPGTPGPPPWEPGPLTDATGAPFPDPPPAGALNPG